jgi:hypothetical protein
MVKKILIAIFIIGAIGAVVGYKMWNKPHPKVEDQKAVSVDADSLFNAFSTDENAANKMYLNKVIQVKGTVADLITNQEGKQVATLATADPMGGIQCTLRENVSFKTGDVVTVKGFCHGLTLGVLLDDCVLVK